VRQLLEHIPVLIVLFHSKLEEAAVTAGVLPLVPNSLLFSKIDVVLCEYKL
jgi:hypothetical protein